MSTLLASALALIAGIVIGSILASFVWCAMLNSEREDWL